MIRWLLYTGSAEIGEIWPAVMEAFLYMEMPFTAGLVYELSIFS